VSRQNETNVAPGKTKASIETTADIVRKGIDDFSALLGLQYARFSFNTNRCLLDQTNLLARIPPDDFQDFILDFTRARKWKIHGEELTAYRNLIRRRIDELVPDGDPEIYADLAVAHVNSYGYDNIDLKGYASAAEEWLKGFGLLNAATTEQRYYFVMELSVDYGARQLRKFRDGGAISDELLSALEREIEEGAYNEEQRRRLTALEARITLYTQPERSLTILRELRRVLPASMWKAKYKYLDDKVNLEGLEKGLRGMEHLEYCTQVRRHLKRDLIRRIEKDSEWRAINQ